MPYQSKILIAAGAIGLTAAAFYFLQSPNAESTVSINRQTNMAPKPPSPTVVLRPKLASENSIVAANAFSSTYERYDKKFQGAQNLRAFVEEAKRDPLHGGLYYARAALSECRYFRKNYAAIRAKFQPEAVGKLYAEDQSLAVAQITAVELQHARCADFTPDELSIAAVSDLKKLGGASDPYMSLHQELAKGSLDKLTLAQRDEILTRIFAQNEPLLLPLAQQVSQKFTTGDQIMAYVDGVPFGGLTPSQYGLAWQLAACKLDEQCQIADYSVRSACFNEGKCFSSVQELISNQAGDKEAAAKVAQVSDRIVSVIRAHNAAPLLPPA